MVTTLLLLSLLFIVGFLHIYFAFSPNKFYAWLQSLFPNPCSSSSSVNLKTTQKVSVMERTDPNKLELNRVFATFDKNGDGFITKQELRESLKAISFCLTENEVEEIVVKLDSNGDGLIDFDEFCALCKAIDDGDFGNNGGEESKRSGEEGNAYEGEILKEAFDVFDRDKDGLITVEELGSVLSSLGLKEGDKVEDCREMIRKVDVNGDGMVDFDEFKTMMKNGGRLASIPAF
ncbi:hypothetical protein F3Y22_tig00111008pilonHSYRG00365 [Hibiscus syriacus]|uniref:EF-hand domain-containing protein n=1 Tax=Hibiscus syriacus TaxID=106335 RepID=A0A6A2Z7M8_HIBSY|nr:calmodulin-like protein 7 [Hibiscus syriacus]KAE8687898.1 hypothetical protein F3Y22_tig00111008pilonHSYRG00365 [Hibiscus syriacus]